jgi:hypothetical protein
LDWVASWQVIKEKTLWRSPLGLPRLPLQLYLQEKSDKALDLKSAGRWAKTYLPAFFMEHLGFIIDLPSSAGLSRLGCEINPSLIG